MPCRSGTTWRRRFQLCSSSRSQPLTSPRALAFAREHGLLVSVKGGGHNIAGTSIAENGLTLDMSRMRELTVDVGARSAHVGPGCRLQDVDHWKTEYLAELSDGFLSALPDLFATCPIPGAELGILHLGGALNEHDEDDGAVGNRDARYVFGVKAMWEPGESNAEGFRQWVRDAWSQLRPFSTGRTYINFQTADEGEERVRATYGVNFDRLVEVKKTYDPDNLFRSNRNIRPR
jgi:hypothetical protein